MPARDLPGPRKLPIVGNLVPFAKDPLAFLTATSRDHGDMATWSVFGESTVQLAHPDDIEALLVRGKKAYMKDRVTRSLTDVVGEGLLTLEGKGWKQHRKIASPFFTPKHLAAYADTMVHSAEEGLPEVGVQDIHVPMTETTMAIVLRTLFGSEPGGNADRIGELVEDMMEAFDIEQHTGWRVVPEWVPARHRRRRDAAQQALSDLLEVLVADRAAGEEGDDLLWRLIQARTDDGLSLTHREVQSEAITLFLAGHETTSLAISYTLLLLAQHPEQQESVHAELDAVLRDRRAGLSDVRSLPVLSSMLEESLRLYPPAWIMGRTLVKPWTVRGVELPAGTEIITPQWVVHRDERWFDQAHRFRPERWRNGETDDLPKFAFYPFGGGPRVCIGNHFARMEALLVLATVLQHRSFVAVPGFEPELIPAVTLRSRNGMQVDVRARSEARRNVA